MRNTENSDRRGGQGFDTMDRDRQREISRMGGRASHGGRGSSSRYDEDDNNRGSYSNSSSRGRSHGGWFGDPEGHSEASERGWENRRGESNNDSYSDRRRSNSDYEDNDRGSNRGGYSHRGSSDYDSYNDNRSRGGRSHGGWFGDPEGHSEASERGWENRSGGASRSRSNYDSDDNDRGRGNSHGGWFGDPEGHSEASERGWEHRRGGNSSNSNRGGGNYNSSSSRSQSDNRGRGHGGWFGDSEGHAEAAERGWENRR